MRSLTKSRLNLNWGMNKTLCNVKVGDSTIMLVWVMETKWSLCKVTQELDIEIEWANKDNE